MRNILVFGLFSVCFGFGINVTLSPFFKTDMFGVKNVGCHSTVLLLYDTLLTNITCRNVLICSGVQEENTSLLKIPYIRKRTEIVSTFSGHLLLIENQLQTGGSSLQPLFMSFCIPQAHNIRSISSAHSDPNKFWKRQKHGIIVVLFTCKAR